MQIQPLCQQLQQQQQQQQRQQQLHEDGVLPGNHQVEIRETPDIHGDWKVTVNLPELVRAVGQPRGCQLTEASTHPGQVDPSNTAESCQQRPSGRRRVKMSITENLRRIFSLSRSQRSPAGSRSQEKSSGGNTPDLICQRTKNDYVHRSAEFLSENRSSRNSAVKTSGSTDLLNVDHKKSDVFDFEDPISLDMSGLDSPLAPPFGFSTPTSTFYCRRERIKSGSEDQIYSTVDRFNLPGVADSPESPIIRHERRSDKLHGAIRTSSTMLNSSHDAVTSPQEDFTTQLKRWSDLRRPRKSVDEELSPMCLNRQRSCDVNHKSRTSLVSRESRTSSHRSMESFSSLASEDSDMVWSDDMDEFDEDADESYHRLCRDCNKEKTELEYDNLSPEHQVVCELVTTEKVYVKKLCILKQAKAAAARILGSETARDMFPNIDSIYALHKDNLLPHLMERLNQWDGSQRIGDMMVMFAPYLKLYSDYVGNLDRAIAIMEQSCQRSQDFAKEIRQLQASAGKRTYSFKVQIKTHMIEPVQRVPRYELLLKQYLKHLPADSADRNHVEDALTSLSEALKHFETRIERQSKLWQLIELQEQVEGPVSLVSPERTLVKKGRIFKICSKSVKAVSRQLFLFNDFLLLCKENTVRIPGSRAKYSVKHRMHVEGLKIIEGDNLEIPHAFYLKTRQKVVELAAGSEEESTEWQKVLWQTVGTRLRQILDRKPKEQENKNNQRQREEPACRLGQAAPTFVHFSDATQCMLCAYPFTNIKNFRKKVHCNACGCVSCSKCSSHTLPLAYLEGREKRVCCKCFLLFNSDSITTFQRVCFKGRSRDNCIIGDYLTVSTNGGRNWHRRHFEVHEGGVLFSFRGKEDISPVCSVPLFMCKVQMNLSSATRTYDYLATSPSGKYNQRYTLHLSTFCEKYTFRMETQAKLLRWLEVLKDAITTADSPM